MKEAKRLFVSALALAAVCILGSLLSASSAGVETRYVVEPAAGAHALTDWRSQGAATPMAGSGRTVADERQRERLRQKELSRIFDRGI